MKRLNFIAAVVCSLAGGFLASFLGPGKLKEPEYTFGKPTDLLASSLQPALDYAFAADEAIVFVDFEWSSNSKIGLRRFNALIESAIKQNEMSGVDVCVLQMTDATDGQRDRFPVVFHGNGEVVWLKKGKVLDSALIWDFASLEEFLGKTQSVFYRS